jgi:hypothetical protein
VLFAHFSIFKYCSFLERLIQSEHSGTAEVEWGGGGDAQEIIVVVLLEAEDDAEAGIKGTPGE